MDKYDENIITGEVILKVEKGCKIQTKDEYIKELHISGMTSSARYYKKAVDESNVEGIYAATYDNQWHGDTIVFGAQSDIDAVIFAKTVAIDKRTKLDLVFRLKIETHKIAQPTLIYEEKDE